MYRPPYEWDELYAVCKACRMVLLESDAGNHDSCCTASAVEKEKVIIRVLIDGYRLLVPNLTISLEEN